MSILVSSIIAVHSTIGWSESDKGLWENPSRAPRSKDHTEGCRQETQDIQGAGVIDPGVKGNPSCAAQRASSASHEAQSKKGAHAGGPHPQRDTIIARLFVENLGCFLDGRPMKEVVDRQAAD